MVKISSSSLLNGSKRPKTLFFSRLKIIIASLTEHPAPPHSADSFGEHHLKVGSGEEAHLRLPAPDAAMARCNAGKEHAAFEAGRTEGHRGRGLGYQGRSSEVRLILN